MKTEKLDLDYENLCFRYKNFLSGDRNVNFSTDDFNILFNKIKELEEKNIKSKIVIDKLHNENNELNKYKTEFKKLYVFAKKTEEELNQIKNKAFIPKKKIQQITDQQIQEIKTLRNYGLSYSEIERQTKWSKYTISRVLNGHYDNK